MVGAWAMDATVAGHTRTDDVQADWVMNHQYLRVHELSREKNKDGLPHYEATIFIGWDAARSQYSCVWLDVFGGVSARSIGTAPRGGDKLPFLFELTAGMRTHTTMSWLPDQTWEWTIDEDEHGKTSRFATLRLHRR